MNNSGISFGWNLPGVIWVVGAMLVVLWLLVVRKFNWGLLLIWVGGVMNWVERVRWGYIRDYFKVGNLYNNVADWIIFVGVVIFLAERIWKKLK